MIKVKILNTRIAAKTIGDNQLNTFVSKGVIVDNRILLGAGLRTVKCPVPLCYTASSIIEVINFIALASFNQSISKISRYGILYTETNGSASDSFFATFIDNCITISSGFKVNGVSTCV